MEVTLILYKIAICIEWDSSCLPSAPATGEIVAARLLALGEQLRAQRKRLGVSATTAAEAAGMSRVTLHRIERGEPSVTMGAWLNAAAALGLELGVVDARPPPTAPRAGRRARAHPPGRLPAARAPGLAVPGRQRRHAGRGAEPVRAQLAAHRSGRAGARTNAR